MANGLSYCIGVSNEEIDYFFIIQINIYSIWEMMDCLGQFWEKVYIVMYYYGYIGLACILMVFNKVYEEGKFKVGQLAYFIGLGGGLVFVSVVVCFGEELEQGGMQRVWRGGLCEECGEWYVKGVKR